MVVTPLEVPATCDSCRGRDWTACSQGVQGAAHNVIYFIPIGPHLPMRFRKAFREHCYRQAPALDKVYVGGLILTTGVTPENWKLLYTCSDDYQT
jgi:primosomal protein N'